MQHDTRCRVVLTLAACLAAAPAQAQFAARRTPTLEDYHVELGATFWKPDPDVVLRFGAAGNDIDLITLFEIPEERFTDLRLVVKPGRKHKIRVQHVTMAYQKDKTFHLELTVAGRTVSVDLPASTSFKWNLWRLGYEWDVISGGGGFIGIIGELKYNRIVTDVSSTPINASASADSTAPAPAIGGIVRGYLSKNVSVTAEATGLNLRGDTYRAEFTDVDAYATYNTGRNVALNIGYRSVKIDYLVDEDAGQLEMKGLYWGLTVRF